MAVSFTTLQIYDQYLTTYRSRDYDSSNRKVTRRSSRYDTHDQSELQNVYSAIQWKNRFAPLYLTEPSPKSIAFAVHLKESAQNLKQTINSLSGDNNDLFSMKTAYSDNEDLATVEYVPEEADDDVPANFSLEVESFASPQVNTGKFVDASHTTQLKPDSYSFDILSNKLHYELQFNINEGETNKELQSKLSRLINSSDIGVSAKVVEQDGLSALEITSDAFGLPYQSARHFIINDDNTSYHNGVVDYLGLNDNVKEASNAIYSINGNEESSYSNAFNVHGAYRVTLHPENGLGNAEIRLYADTESLSHNIETFVDGCNHFLDGVLTDLPEDKEKEDDLALTRLLSKDMTKFLDVHRQNLEKYGITVNEDASLDYEKPDETVMDTDALKGFGNHMMRKLTSISLDPMEYIDRRICAYPNPFTNYINPYMTSIYTGMLFNTYT